MENNENTNNIENIENTENKEVKEDKYAPLGGQAVIEGVMMRSPDKISVAVRKESGDITTKVWPYVAMKDKSKIWGLPFIRGVVALGESLYWGMKTLNYSADVAYTEEAEKPPSPFWTSISFIFAMIIAIGLFMGIPGFIFIQLKPLVPQIFLLNIIEGAVRITIFIGYLLAINFMPEVKRLFQYHGAEHKVIHAHEKKEDLIWDNVKKHNPAHPRCGTSFLLITLLISIVVFSFLGKSPTLLIRVLSKLALLPIVAGISYELIRQAGKYDLLKAEDSALKKFFVKTAYTLTLPGLWLQKITTDEPDEKQVEVAVEALNKALK